MSYSWRSTRKRSSTSYTSQLSPPSYLSPSPSSTNMSTCSTEESHRKESGASSNENTPVAPLGRRASISSHSFRQVDVFARQTLENVEKGVDHNDNHKSRSFSIAEALGGSFRTIRDATPRRMSKRMKMAKKSRLIQKSGDCSIYSWNVPKRNMQFWRDIFTTMIDVQWRYILCVFTITFLLSWTGFAVLYTAINKYANFGASPNETCIENIPHMIDAFLYSIETQHTIGYGTRVITNNCPLAIVVLCAQCITGMILQSFMVGLVFAKMARAKKRAETLIFSDQALITLRDGALCFLFRIGDMRSTHLVEAHVRMQMIKQRITLEGECEALHQYEMRIGEGGNDERLFLVWPYTVCHVIDKHSPLYDVTQASLPMEQFEIIVLMEGIVESTGMTVQARTSYLPKEILWGHRFEPLVTYQRDDDDGRYRVDYSVFNESYSVHTPSMSQRELQYPGDQSSNPLAVDTSTTTLTNGGWRLTSPHPPTIVVDSPSPSPVVGGGGDCRTSISGDCRPSRSLRLALNDDLAGVLLDVDAGSGGIGSRSDASSLRSYLSDVAEETSEPSSPCNL